MVTGGDALVEVSDSAQRAACSKATVLVNGADVTVDARARTTRRARYTGMVTGLRLGANTLFADSNGRGNGRPDGRADARRTIP